MELSEKYQKLRDNLRSLGSVCVAFSGGVDSTFLLYVAHQVLGSSAIAVTAQSCSFPKRELDEAKAFCKSHGITHLICRSEELDIEGFRQNPKNRCYLCKHELFEKIWEIAKQNGISAVAEGSNLDDNGDYRPGLIAVKELGVKSPLREAELTKAEIRELSRKLGLPTWNKQSFACLSSRFVYGETISEEKLSMVDRAEQLLLNLGFHQVRVRRHAGIEPKSVFTGIFPPILRQPRSTYASMPSFGFLVLTKICSVKTAMHLTARDFGDSFVPCDAGRLAPVKEQGAKIAQKNRREAARVRFPHAYSRNDRAN